MVPPRCTPFDPAKHIVHSTELATSLRRRLGLPGLFTYKHRDTKNWVVAYWVNKNQGWMMELTLMGSLDGFGPSNFRTLETWAKGKSPTAESLIREDMRNLKAQEVRESEENDNAMEHKRALGKLCPGVMKEHPFWEVPGLGAPGV